MFVNLKKIRSYESKSRLLKFIIFSIYDDGTKRKHSLHWNGLISLNSFISSNFIQRIKTSIINFVRFIWQFIYSFKVFVSPSSSTNLFVILFSTEKTEKYLLRKTNVLFYLNLSFRFQNAGAEKTIGVFWFYFSSFGKKAS